MCVVLPDESIRTVAAKLRKIIRETEYFYRMKILSFLITAPLMVICSCSAPEGEIESDSMATADQIRDSISQRYVIENVLNFSSESDLVKVYGKENIVYDTIWGAEGLYAMGTMINVDSFSRVEIMWMNEKERNGLISATLVSEGDIYGAAVPVGIWESSTGLKLGMTIEQVEKINGRPFQFSGFGWDYGGGLISWEGGTLEGKGISIQIAEGAGTKTIPEKEYITIIGDIPVLSDNETARKSDARVWSISVAKVQ